MDSVQKKILDISLENEIGRFSKFSDSYSATLYELSKDFSHNPARICQYLVTELGYGEISMDLLSGRTKDVVSKTVLVLLSLIEEAEQLLEASVRTRNTFFSIDTALNEMDSNVLDGQISIMSGHFKFLCTTARMILRLIECARSLTEQCVAGLSIAFPKGDMPIALSEVINVICRIMRHIETFDQIIDASKLKFLWGCFKGKVFNHFQLIASAKGVSSFIEELDVFFMENYFDMFLTEINSTKGVAHRESLALFSAAVLRKIKDQIKEAHKFSDLSDYLETDTLINVPLLVVFSFHYLGNITSGVFKQLLSLTGKQCAVSILPNVLWRPEVFLARHAGELIDKQWSSYSTNLQNQRKVYLQGKLDNIHKTVKIMSFQVIAMIFEINRVFSGAKKLKSAEDLQNAITTLTQHAHLSGQLRCLITNLINLHIAFELDLPRSALIAIGKLVELLVSMRWAIEGCAKGIQFTLQTSQELYQFKLLTATDTLRRTWAKAGQRDANKWALVQLLEKCTDGALTRKRLQILRLINTEAALQMLATDSDATTVGQWIQNLEFCTTHYATTTGSLLDTSVLLGHRQMLKVYLKNYILRQEDPTRLTNFITALTDQQAPADDFAVVQFRKTMKAELVEKVSREIETRLRLDFHKKLSKGTAESSSTFKDLRSTLSLEPVQAFGEYFVIKGHVEKELSKTFYNLITVSPNDCRTYVEMQEMGRCCLDLTTIPDGLPVRTVDQACDIMDILKDLSVFVDSFCYDMNSQVFLEKTSPNKHLNAILVSHVSQSITTHGIGIINTTVNVTYQFLKKKFHLLSQLLFDEHLKSRLIRDHRIVTERIINKTTPVYPLEAAANVIKYLRHVSLSTAISYMDRFRQLVIDIGNALGFVRSMRSGRLQMGANALEHFNGCADRSYAEAKLEEEHAVGKQYRDSTECLEDNFTESADYLKMLVNAFQRHIQTDKFAHLRQFYLIVPALAMNYVEYMIILKEDLAGLPRSRCCHQYTDDGFTVGLVYLLTLLDQIDKFNSLHFFATVDQYYTDQIQKLKSPAPNDGIDQEKVMQTRSLSEKRFRALQREFNLLYYNLCSSKIFFQ